MANLPNTEEWVDVYQLEMTDPVLGGTPNESTGAGMDNIPHLHLAKRTSWLKARVDGLISKVVQATTTVAGIVRLNNTLTSTAADQALTAAQGKILNDQKAPKASPAFTGVPTAPTPATEDDSAAIATTNWVRKIVVDASTAVAGIVRLNNTLNSTATDQALTAAQGKALNDAKAPIASPAFTGSPTAPSPAAADSSTRIATTSWVRQMFVSASTTLNNTLTSTATDQALTAAQGKVLNDTKAPIASPTFTGSPTAPAPAAADSSTRLATTAWVRQLLVAASTAVAGIVRLNNTLTSTATDQALTAAQGKALNDTKAPLASPAFTGSPTAPSPANTDNSTRLATTTWVRAALGPIAQAAGFASNLGVTGYIRFPSWLGGWIVQWGYSTITNGAGQNVTLPIAYPNAHMQCVANDAGDVVYRVSSSPVSLTQIRIYARDTAGNLTGANTRWISLGY